jgi:hypothetical protein
VDAFFQIREEILSISKRFENKVTTKMIQSNPLLDQASVPDVTGGLNRKDVRLKA